MPSFEGFFLGTSSRSVWYFPIKFIYSPSLRGRTKYGRGIPVAAKTKIKDRPSRHSLKDERCSKRIRHSLRSCRLCRFFLLLLRDIDHADEVPPDDKGLLFCPCAGDFLRFLHLDLLHEKSDDLCGKFRNVRIPAHHSQEGIYIQALFPSFRNCCLQFGNSCFQLLLLGFVGCGHSEKTVVGYFPVEVILVEPLHDTIQFLDALFRLNKFLIAVAHQTIEFIFVLLRDQFYKFRFMGTCISRNAL